MNPSGEGSWLTLRSSWAAMCVVRRARAPRPARSSVRHTPPRGFMPPRHANGVNAPPDNATPRSDKSLERGISREARHKQGQAEFVDALLVSGAEGDAKEGGARGQCLPWGCPCSLPAGDRGPGNMTRGGHRCLPPKREGRRTQAGPALHPLNWGWASRLEQAPTIF